MNGKTRFTPLAAFLTILTVGLLATVISISGGRTIAKNGTARTPEETVRLLRAVNLPALRLAVKDLAGAYGAKYPKSAQYLAKIDQAEKSLPTVLDGVAKGDPSALTEADQIITLQREALLSNPLIDFDKMLLIRRGDKQLGLPQNWESNSSLPQAGYDNEIAVLSGFRDDPQLSTLIKPEGGRFVGDIDLHYNADRLLFSMPGDNGRWQIHEIRTDGTALRQLPLIHEPDVDNYDACYLPDGGVMFTSTAPFTGVPCVTGTAHVSQLYRLDNKGGIRRLSFGQDHDWCPTVLSDGSVMYQRWEYSDIPHYVARILFTMNPDGTGQREHYGSNSYWPNAMFYAKQTPNNPSRFVAIVGGHHDVPRMGELVLFDSTRGQREADGVVQRIPERGKQVKPIIRDELVRPSWPKFLHPYPVSDKYYLVSAQPTATSSWGIYLVDAFDNMLLIKETPGSALFQPVPIHKRPTPPVIPDRVVPSQKDARIVISDIYSGPGLKDVPRGTVKKLRLFTYNFAYHNMGGQVNRVGLDGPWDVKCIMGTVPVNSDGSAYFRVPANTPISVQPLDGEGKSLQLMRSWMTAMPGETLSCVGCHESQNTSLRNRAIRITSAKPADIKPWYGPTRGFSFRNEVQPVLDRYCVSCHNGNDTARPNFKDLPDVHPSGLDPGYNNGSHFPPSYIALRSYVRAATIESDIHLLDPYEYHADTTRLVRMLKKGHQGVKLNGEAWDRLVTWIDLNTPAMGSWSEIVGEKLVNETRFRRNAMNKLYSNLDTDLEVMPQTKAFANLPAVSVTASQPTMPRRGKSGTVAHSIVTDKSHSIVKTISLGSSEQLPVSYSLGSGVKLKLARIPAGTCTMGDETGNADERPATTVKISKPFLIGACEVTNEQYALFDPSHDSRLETGDFLRFSEQERGYPVNDPKQPVCRVSWNEAMAFCRWLSRKTGKHFTLPTEAQWEYACRAGSSAPLSYGEVGTDFSKLANLADSSLRKIDTFGWGLPSGAVPPWRPAIESVNDGYRVSAPVGIFPPNLWGLYDMHGNVAEWTRTLYRAYPYSDSDGRNDLTSQGDRVVRGGSWYDRPQDARSSYRAAYHPWQGVYDVGFRVVCEDAQASAVTRR